MSKADEKIIRSGNETWRGAKDASEAAKCTADVEHEKSTGKINETNLDGEDVTKRDARSVKITKNGVT